MAPPNPTTHRRPIRSRQHLWARVTAAWLARRSLHPNQLSALSVVFAALAGLCALLLPSSNSSPLRIALMLGAALAIQLRLLCNLFDGMVAVEGGQATPAGAVWNDLPDRLADPLILVPVGYAITVPWGVELGWLAGVLAVLTAYVRVLGGALGLPQDFRGPLAKPQRMAVLTVAWLGAILEELLGGAGWVLVLALLIIALGSGITALRRTRHLVRALERGAAA